jgi:Haem-binding domain
VSLRRTVRITILSLVGAFILIQFLPYGRDHDALPVSAEPAWDSQETRALTDAACFDCHSNETDWPWYASVAPMSWLTQRDVDRGREALNFSEWDRPQGDAEDVTEVIAEGEMPPWYYAMLHAGARLSDQEQRRLIEGLRATLRVSPPIEDDRSHGGED